MSNGRHHRRVCFRTVFVDLPVRDFLAVFLRFAVVFFVRVVFRRTRSGNAWLPVLRFHSSYVCGEILPSTSSCANLRRCAWLLNGMNTLPDAAHMIALILVGLSNRRAFLGVFVGACSLLLHTAGRARQSPAVTGLDHVPIAVRDLEAAAETYRRLGFALKPGRPHDNGIRNQHVKFPDGTELELITAPEARDPLTTTYRTHLEAGDGPAFLALYAPDASRVPRDLDAPLGYLFFGPRNASPTDLPEHFAHANSAETLAAVWLADNDLEPERTLFAKLGGTVARRAVHVPDRVGADVARFGDGEVVLLPGARQRVAGRRIVGVTVRVRSLSTASELLKSRGIPTTASGEPASKSLFLAPETAHGLWIELRERP